MASLQPYPLYDRLRQRVEESVGMTTDITKMCATINSISQNHSASEAENHYREIGALVLHHSIKSGNLSSACYDGKVMVGGKGILYYLNKLPQDLQHIIAQYVNDPTI